MHIKKELFLAICLFGMECVATSYMRQKEIKCLGGLAIFWMTREVFFSIFSQTNINTRYFRTNSDIFLCISYVLSQYYNATYE